MKYSHISIALLLSASLTAFAAAQSHDHSKMHMKPDTSRTKDVNKKMVKERFTCPMHPEVISDKPGKCPKCGMTLVNAKPVRETKKHHKAQKDTTHIRPK